MKLAQELVKVALEEVGVEEIDGTNCGEGVNVYKATTNLPPDEGWPWCAAFVCWCVRKAAFAAVLSIGKILIRSVGIRGCREGKSEARASCLSDSY